MERNYEKLCECLNAGREPFVYNETSGRYENAAVNAIRCLQGDLKQLSSSYDAMFADLQKRETQLQELRIENHKMRMDIEEKNKYIQWASETIAAHSAEKNEKQESGTT